MLKLVLQLPLHKQLAVQLRLQVHLHPQVHLLPREVLLELALHVSRRTAVALQEREKSPCG